MVSYNGSLPRPKSSAPSALLPRLTPSTEQECSSVIQKVVLGLQRDIACLVDAAAMRDRQ